MKTGAFVLAISCLAAASASARTPQQMTVSGDFRSIVVTYADLDIDRAEGAAALVNRIDHAARAICGPAPVAQDLYNHMTYRDCMSSSTRMAVRRVDAPRVTDAYNGRRPVLLAEH
jgi:UrcA family protein